MKRITTVLKESEAMVVRKAVCAAGGERVVITPMSQRPCALGPEKRDCEQPAALTGTHVCIEVTADDSHCGGIVSAIQRIAHIGKIGIVSRHDRPHRCAAYNQSLGSLLP